MVLLDLSVLCTVRVAQESQKVEGDMDFFSKSQGQQNNQQQQDPVVITRVSASMELEGTDIKWNGSLQSSSPYSQIHQTTQKLQQQLTTIGQEQLLAQYQHYSGQSQQSQQGQQPSERKFAVAGS